MLTLPPTPWHLETDKGQAKIVRAMVLLQGVRLQIDNIIPEKSEVTNPVIMPRIGRKQRQRLKKRLFLDQRI